MNFTVETMLVAGLVIIAWELLAVALAYFMRDHLKRSINMFLGRTPQPQKNCGGCRKGLVTQDQLVRAAQRGEEELDEIKKKLEVQNRFIANKLKDISDSVRNGLRESKEKVEENSAAIKKLKTTKANSSAVKKLAAAQEPAKKSKTVRVTKTGRKPTRKGR